tara:strand:+ start:372 stop:512 length:141 start_codon:yes stop_codon:yes gene_type:complete
MAYTQFDDDTTKVIWHPKDDCLSNPQSRRYLKTLPKKDDRNNTNSL